MRAISGIFGTAPTARAVQQMQLAMVRDKKCPPYLWQKGEACLMGNSDQTEVLEWQLEGRELAVVFSGILTNAPELRTQLQQDGVTVSESPQELILRSYLEWGEHCPEHLSGAFAFAIWEPGTGQLFLARDHMGQQPLFYSLRGKTLLVASELHTILAYPGFRACIDASGAAELLLIGPGRTPGCGVFRGISELEPGCCGLWERGRLRLRRYWKLTDGPHTMDFQQTSEAVGILVTDAIRRLLPENLECGAFLSGGLDSGIVCAVCAEAMAEQGRRLSTFSVDYVNNDRYFVPGKFQPSADADYMGILEEALHTDAHRILLSPEQLEQGIEDGVLARDLPGMGDVDISLLQLCRQVRRTVPMALSGECADELFGGYPWYRDPEIRNRAGFPWAQSTARRAQLFQGNLSARVDAEEYIRCRYEDTLAQSDILPDAPAQEKRMKQMMNLNLRWFMQTLLERNYRMSRMADLEVRVPFCDRHLAELLYRVPWEMKDYHGFEKGLLRHAMAPWLPAEILMRKKSPYPKTHDPRFLQQMKSRLERLLGEEQAPVWSLIRPEAARSLAGQESDWPFYGQLMRMPQTICYLLQLDFWLRHYNVDLELD